MLSTKKAFQIGNFCYWKLCSAQFSNAKVSISEVAVQQSQIGGKMEVVSLLISIIVLIVLVISLFNNAFSQSRNNVKEDIRQSRIDTKEDIRYVLTELHTIKNELGIIKHEIGNMKVDAAILKGTVENIQKEVSTMREKLDKTDKEIETIKRDINDIKKENEKSFQLNLFSSSKHQHAHLTAPDNDASAIDSHSEK